MIEITDEREEGFGFGVVYERTRILDSLRLAMKPALAHFEELLAENKIPEGMTPVINLEEIIGWAQQIANHPVHSMQEASHVADQSLEMAKAELREMGRDDLVDEIEQAIREAGEE